MTDAEHMESVRNSLHLNQTQMAKLLGYSGHEPISAIENSKRKMSNQVKAHLRTIETNLESVKKQLGNGIL